MNLIERQILGNPWEAWAIAAAVAALAFSTAFLLRLAIVKRLSRVAERTATQVDDFGVALARATRSLPLFLLAIYLGSLVLDLHERVESLLRTATILAATVQALLWAAAAIDFWIELRQRRNGTDPASATTLAALQLLGKLAFGLILSIVALDLLGVHVTTLVAGLGVTGIAVALATQNILSDLFASLSILIDKPFVLGDAIGVDSLSGTVEAVGLKTTRVRSVSGEQLVFSNADLLKSRLRNYGRLAERRVVLGFGVALGTPAEALAPLPERLREIVEARSDVRFDRAHLKAIGPTSLDFEVVYFVPSPDFKLHMDRQQGILLAIVGELEERGIELANPLGRSTGEAPAA